MKTTIKAFEHIYRQGKSNDGKSFVIIPLAIFTSFLFLPWTQNISTKGKITSLYQEQRPQKINAPIAGKIVKWWIKEGDFVNQGDTIAQISEIKEEYLDPKLIERTQEQLAAKRSVNQYYSDKSKTMEAQIKNLQSGLQLKIEQLSNKLKQLRNKLDGEKAELKAAENDYLLAKDQYERQQKLYAEGLVSQTQWQQRNVILQNSLAKKSVSENKINQTLQEISNTSLEQKSADQEYREKINKTDLYRDATIWLLLDTLKAWNRQPYPLPDECKALKDDIAPLANIEELLSEEYDLTGLPDDALPTEELVNYLRARKVDGSDRKIGDKLTQIGLETTVRRDGRRTLRMRIGIRRANP